MNVPTTTVAVRQHGFSMSKVRCETVPLTITQRDVVIKLVASIVCASDVKQIDKGSALMNGKNLETNPVTIGHELAGEVVFVGDQLSTTLEIGEWVTVQPHIPCGMCGSCTRGQEELCSQKDVLGCSLDGAFARHLVLPERSIRQIIPAPNGVKAWFELASAEYLATIRFSQHHHIHRDFRSGHLHCGLLPRGCVVVLGLGPMGRKHIDVALSSGLPRSIIGIDILPDRVHSAQRSFVHPNVVFLCSAGWSDDELVLSLADKTSGQMADDVIVATSDDAAQWQATRLVRPGGFVSLFGGRTQPIVIDYFSLHYGFALIGGTTGSRRDDMAAELSLIAAGVRHVGDNIAAVAGLPGCLDAIRAARDRCLPGKCLIYNQSDAPFKPISDPDGRPHWELHDEINMLV